MSQDAVLTIKITKTGKTYKAWTTIATPGRKGAWQGGVYSAKTPLDAFQGVKKRIDADLSPGKRGRKPSGYKCLIDLEYGWEAE